VGHVARVVEIKIALKILAGKTERIVCVFIYLFVVYLMTLSTVKTSYVAPNGIMIKELKSVWKEVVVG
jgi:hypothetical protein